MMDAREGSDGALGNASLPHVLLQVGVTQRWHGPFGGRWMPGARQRPSGIGATPRMRCVNSRSALKRSGPDRTLPAAPSNSNRLGVCPALGAARLLEAPRPQPPGGGAGAAARWQRGLRCGDGGGAGAFCGDVVRFLPPSQPVLGPPEL